MKNQLFPKWRVVCGAVYFSITLFFWPFHLAAQSVIGGDTIDPSAILDLQSIDKGLLLPRLTGAQRDAMPNPARGLLIFNTSENCIQINGGQPAAPLWTCLTVLPQRGNQKGNLLYWDGSAWVRLGLGLPGQVLSLSQEGNLVWSGAAFATLLSTAATSVTASSALVGGNITADGGSGVVARGVVYGTTPLPTLANSTLLSGAGTGSFSGIISGLQPGTPYFFRAFASNGAGTAYGNMLNFTTYPLAQVLSLDCANAQHTADLVAGLATSAAASSLSYQGGNGGYFEGQAIPSSGVSGLTATLAPGILANGSGTLVFSISGTPSGSGTASFTVQLGGQSCTLTRAVAPGAVAAIQCSSAVPGGQLVAGKTAAGTSISLPYSGGNGGAHSGQTVGSTGVIGLTASLAAGHFPIGPGSLNYVLTGTATSSGTANFAIQIGGQSCTLSLAVAAGAVTSLDCAGAVHSGTLTIGLAAAASCAIPYTGGNGGLYPAQTVASTGVSGLTATLAAGTFAEGGGTLTYTISGTPSTAGTANFAIQIGGRSCTLTRSVSPALIGMKNIPSGTFTMGCTSGDPVCLLYEAPVHTVSLNAFKISETEVTQSLWQEVMYANPSYFGGCPDCPVEEVSWYDALVFCNRLSEQQGLTPCYYSDISFTQVYGKSGSNWSLPNGDSVYLKPLSNGYALPTEAEWEYAARGGNSTDIYSGGNDLNAVGWYDGDYGGRYGTKPVKGKSPNAYGLYDMSGNVWEWCWDRFGLYSSSSKTNPAGPEAGYNRIFRGGCWKYENFKCRSAFRNTLPPVYRAYDVGFRVVLH